MLLENIVFGDHLLEKQLKILYQSHISQKTDLMCEYNGPHNLNR